MKARRSYLNERDPVTHVVVMNWTTDKWLHWATKTTFTPWLRVLKAGLDKAGVTEVGRCYLRQADFAFRRNVFRLRYQNQGRTSPSIEICRVSRNCLYPEFRIRNGEDALKFKRQARALLNRAIRKKMPARAR